MIEILSKRTWNYKSFIHSFPSSGPGLDCKQGYIHCTQPIIIALPSASYDWNTEHCNRRKIKTHPSISPGSINLDPPYFSFLKRDSNEVTVTGPSRNTTLNKYWISIDATSLYGTTVESMLIQRCVSTKRIIWKTRTHDACTWLGDRIRHRASRILPKAPASPSRIAG